MLCTRWGKSVNELSRNERKSHYMNSIITSDTITPSDSPICTIQKDELSVWCMCGKGAWGGGGEGAVGRGRDGIVAVIVTEKYGCVSNSKLFYETFFVDWTAHCKGTEHKCASKLVRFQSLKA